MQSELTHSADLQPPANRAHLLAFYDAAKLYGHRWTFEILGALTAGPMRFTDLLRAIDPTPHPKSLRDALRRLQYLDLVHHPNHGEGALYRLAPAARELLPLISSFAAQLQRWSADHGAPRF